ncbi:ABC transporter ATP-binding protein [Paenibacillus sp. J45TS6]|uniref:ABC transporter ATP-binding protein n=1 Tax=Paenibacillus sp. J45TS6 TaxID=2807196 RepID=UPI001B1EB885|nr:ABC transporter ATP-binding protein [Paenibacillus sp. J45TS6]GIP43449.1 ABC transporter ATP-binding protein [Paenibacillus sp. J45TS6]
MLEVKNVYKYYKRSGNGLRKKKLNVLQDVSFHIRAGECVGLVGESGSGKSTLGRLILGLEKADAGSIRMEDKEITRWIKENKGQMSVVFQDYTSSANPYYKVSDVISELLRAFGTAGGIQKQVEYLLQKVGLPLSVANRYPHELSGGELQRVCIARAISRNPRFLVLDEAISSLDVSTQSQIMELLFRLKENDNMTILFIAHDLQAVSHLCDRVMFMENGQIVEQIASSNLSEVQNEYAKRLLDSVISFHV